MKIQAEYSKFPLYFRFRAGTSRGVLTSKVSYMLKIYFSHDPGRFGIGEVSLIAGLSPDDVSDLEPRLHNLCQKIGNIPLEVNRSWVNPDFVVPVYSTSLVPDTLPAVRFGMETALLDLLNGGHRMVFNNSFYTHAKPITINGLIWMGDKEYMLNQIAEKLEDGFTSLKVKIGGANFEDELELLKSLRKEYTAQELSIRLDANGAFSADNAMEYLNRLSEVEPEILEQPIKPGQIQEMAAICEKSLVPIGLDEELIGITDLDNKLKLLETVKPKAVILKPSLLGGFQAGREWIEVAEELGIRWWLSSALESNVGLNALAQFSANYDLQTPQGLGTGNLYRNNIGSPLELKGNKLTYNKKVSWEV
ncbi:MAG: o-succinylbenzoate synthase [Bacteroidota bacterium]